MKGLPRSLRRNRRADDNDSGLTFSLAGGDINKTIQSILQGQAKIAASSVTALTDSSGGAAADGTIGAITQVTNAVLGSNDATQKAAGETALGTTKDAIMELIDQTQAINAVVPALGGSITNSLGGTASDKTIGAITSNVSGVGASLMSAAGCKAFVTAAKSRIAQLTVLVNKICVACGVDPIIDNSGGTVVNSLTFAALSTGTGTATSGGDTTDANATVLATDFNATQALFAAAVKEIATKLNACRSATGGTMEVVAKA